MHNRKEGALALLAAHGGGLLISSQKFVEYANPHDNTKIASTAAFITFFGVGAGLSYLALRYAGDNEEIAPKRFLLLERASAFLLAMLILAFGVLTFARFPDFSRSVGCALTPATSPSICQADALAPEQQR